MRTHAALVVGTLLVFSTAHAAAPPSATTTPLPASFVPHSIANGVIAGDDGANAAIVDANVAASGAVVDVVVAADVGATQAHANAINAAGDVAGTIDGVAFVVPHDASGVVTMLQGEDARGIDDAGDVVGARAGLPTLWRAGDVNGVPLPFAETAGVATCISPDGNTIGGDSDAGGVAWSFDDAIGQYVEVGLSILDIVGQDQSPIAPRGCGNAFLVGFASDGGAHTPIVLERDVSDTGDFAGFSPQRLGRLDGTLAGNGDGEALGITSDGTIAAGFDVDAAGHRRATVWFVRAHARIAFALDDGGALDAGITALDRTVGDDGTIAAIGDVAGAATLFRMTPPPDQAPIANDDVIVRHLPAGANAIVDADSTEDGVLLNDGDPDGDLLRVAEANVPLTTADGGTITFDDGGGFVYVPPDASPRTDSVTYHASDGTLTSAATLTLVIANAAPVVVAEGAAHFHPVVTDAPATAEYDSTADALSFLTLVHDDDPADVLTVVEANSTIATEHGSLFVRDDGTFTFAPHAGFVGVEALLVHVTDGIAPPVVVGIAVAIDDHAPTAPTTKLGLDAGTVGGHANVLLAAVDADEDAVSAVPAVFTTPNGGNVVVAKDGSVTFEGFGIGADAFDVAITDGWARSSVHVDVLAPTTAAPPRLGFPIGPGVDPAVCGAASPSTWATFAAFAALLLTPRARRARRDRRSAHPST